MLKLYIVILITISTIFGSSNLYALELGADRMDNILPHLKGKRVGLIINHTSVVGKRQVSLLDTLMSRGVNVKRVFAPEHGFRGNADAGESVANGRDIKSGVPIISLYGANKRPKREDLADLDIVVYDIQGVGTRFYTYISTMFYAMESCSEHGVSFMVLDRPNPNDYIDGAVMVEELRSFVGALPIPILYGLTVGELSRMIQGEGWLGGRTINLTVIPMVGWQHGQPYILPIKPSPNLPNAQAVALYPSLCLFEATGVSVGRGTYTPFQMLGYPDPKYGEFTFTPRSLVGFDKNPLQRDKLCYGVDLREVSPPKGLSLKYLIDFWRLSGQGAEFVTNPRFFDMLSGDPTLRRRLLAGESEEQIKASWAAGLEEYKIKRKRYLLYKDK